MDSSKKKAGARGGSAASPGRARGAQKATSGAARKPASAVTKRPASAVTKRPASAATKKPASTRTKRPASAKTKKPAPAPKTTATKAAAGMPSAPKTARKTAAPAIAKAAVERKVAATAKKAAPARSNAAGAARRPAVARPGRRGAASEDHPPLGVPGLSEEDQIRAAKYLPRELPKRLFEEDRFLFPETYGVNRVRLLVRDPEWIFAYWDVNPAALKDLGRSLGERGLALSRLTLRVQDPLSGGASDILLPPGARWWYIRTDSARRSYRAELGVTLPSGEFRRLAESNTVVTPRVGPSPQRARRRMSYRDALDLPPSAAEAAGLAETEAGLSREPWAAESVDGSVAPGGPGASSGKAVRGGASDVFRPGGASDTFRR